jgi:twitching motility protein PilT
MSIQELLSHVIKNNASDLHLLIDIPPAMRIDGSLRYISSSKAMTKQDLETMILSLLNHEQKEMLFANKEIDFSFTFDDGMHKNTGRFRVNIYYEKGYMSAAFRFLESNIRTIEDLHLPKIVESFSQLKHGFVLVTGPTSHGKSTTLAAIINNININRAEHILTIEDPIEYIYPPGKSIISQRSMGIDTHSWNAALRSALREDPNVVLVGEMRDPETIAAAITVAETGHLVFSTLHTNSASQSIDRIIDSFPADQQPQIKAQLAAALKGIVSQRLIPKIEGGRIPAVEVLLGTSAVISNIREGKTYLIDSTIQTSHEVGMISLESSLASLVKDGSISLETAKSYAIHQDYFMRIIE